MRKKNVHDSQLVRVAPAPLARIPAIVRTVVGRCPASYSNSEAIRDFVRRLKPGFWRRLPRSTRKRWMRYVIRQHERNRALYGSLMGGGWNYTEGSAE